MHRKTPYATMSSKLGGITINRQALRKISLEKLMDLKVDYAFKQLFGSERNKDITVVFLNAILQRSGRDNVKEIIFVSQEVGGEFDGDKHSRLDIVVKTQENHLINIEIQVSNQHDMVKRTLFYWSKLYTGQLKKGMGYYELMPTITINICNFSLFKDIDNYHTIYHLQERELKSRLEHRDDVLEIHFIEMNKFLTYWHGNKLNPLDDLLARWLLLLGMVDARKDKVYEKIYKELELLAMKDENLLKAFDAWEELSQSPETMIAYQSRLKYIIDEEAKIKHAEHKGQEKGIEIGIELGVEKNTKKTIQNCLEKDFSLELIAEITELSIEQVEEIIKSMK